MGYALAMGTCLGCKKMFGFNPMRVPSIRSPDTGSKEPICLECVGLANVHRKELGLELIVPLPGAYDACDEGELG